MNLYSVRHTLRKTYTVEKYMEKHLLFKGMYINRDRPNFSFATVSRQFINDKIYDFRNDSIVLRIFVYVYVSNTFLTSVQQMYFTVYWITNTRRLYSIAIVSAN